MGITLAHLKEAVDRLLDRTALTAGLTSTESFAGKLRLRAQQTPTAAITAVYYIVK